MSRPKILYAATNRLGASYQFRRCLSKLSKNIYDIKTAGYRRMNEHLDWTLDALLDIKNPSYISINNDNFDILFEQIKSFNPNLIISDLEPYTSYAGQLLNIPVWQVSPLLLYQCDLKASNIKSKNVFNKYQVLYNDNFLTDQLIKNIIINSEKKFVYSYLADTDWSITLPTNFEWMRPYHTVGEFSQTCQHCVVASVNTTKIINSINLKYNKSKIKDVVIFSDTRKIINTNFIYKNINFASEYACNVKNCEYFLTDGSTDTISDAFYNNKYCIIIPELFEKESILNMLLAERCGLGHVAYTGRFPNSLKIVQSNYKDNIPYLHTKIDEYFHR